MVETLLSVPHVELLGIIGCIAIASIAAWSSATLHMRMKLIERDLDDLYDEVAVIRHERAHAAQPVPLPHGQPQPQPMLAASPPIRMQPARPPVLEPLYAQFQGPSAGGGAAQATSGGQPNVQQIARQLAAQTPEAMGQVLTPALDLGVQYSTLGAGRQETRLLRWLHAR